MSPASNTNDCFREFIGKTRWQSITVQEYDIPVAVHAQWCAWCAEQEGAR